VGGHYVDENMHWPWADIQGPLVTFLEEMVEAAEVADLYKRYNTEKFRGVREKRKR